MSSYFGREQRIRDLMNIIQDERYTRTDLTSILDTCLRHMVPHNNNNYTININNRPPTYTSHHNMENIDILDDTLDPDLAGETDPLSNQLPVNSAGTNDLNSTIQNFVTSIMNEVSNAPSDSVRVHLNTPTTNTTGGSGGLVPVSLDMMITDTNQTIDSISQRLTNLSGLDGASTTINVTTSTNTDQVDTESHSSDDELDPTDVAPDSQNGVLSENQVTSQNNISET